ncbi:hypothetical protein [Hymenobacter rubidus]|uniref:hypothetical protein n=1 Tax=Hymenobacter rubidus TaxID=1441626 RepID=UPI00191DBE9F|nr:hypothetical protein [Hymenobacter rubidus]
MAANSPVPSPVALTPTVEAWLADVNTRFADNTFGNTTELDFRETFAGLAQVFADWRHLSTKRLKGGTYPVPYTDNLGQVPPDYRILGAQAQAVNGVDSTTGATGVVKPPVFFALIRDSHGTVDALLDAEPATTLTVKARWAQISGTALERIASFDELVLEDVDYDAGDVRRYTFPDGHTDLVQWKADSVGFSHPVPTGLDSDPIYRIFSAPSAHDHEQNSDLGTYQPQFIIRMGSQERGTGAVRTCLVFEGMNRQAAALSFRAQDADGVRRPAFEICLAWTGRSSDVWVPLGGDSSSAVSQLQAAIDAQTDRLNNLVAGAPEALDTLAEIAAQQAADETGTAAMLATQQQHTQQIAANAGFLGTVNGLLTTAKNNVVAAINELYGKMGTVKTINGTAPDADGNVVVAASSGGSSIGTGTVIQFDQDRDYQELATGTFTFDKSVLKMHTIVTALLGAGCSPIALDDSFEGSGTYIPGQKHEYVFWIHPTAAASKVQYLIKTRA